MLERARMIQESLARTRKSVFGQIKTLFGATEIDEDTWDELEALLIQADLGVDTTMQVMERLRGNVWRGGAAWREG